MSAAHALAQLRHLYSQMIGGDVRYPAEAAKGLLGPAIAKMERFLESQQTSLRSAEAAAYERAAKAIDALAEQTRNKGRQDTLWVAADTVRALASKETP